MFRVGDRVRNIAANVVGTVVDVDGDRVYLEQENGCEVDFAAAALVLESAFQKKHDTTARADAGAQANDAAYAAVLANLYPAIIEKGQAFHAGIRRVPGVATPSWDSLSPLQKLNAVSEATAVPVKTWIEASRPGAKTPLSALQLSILKAGKTG
jgi:hypothetical protein